MGFKTRKHAVPSLAIDPIGFRFLETMRQQYAQYETAVNIIDTLVHILADVAPQHPEAAADARDFVARARAALVTSRAEADVLEVEFRALLRRPSVH